MTELAVTAGVDPQALSLVYQDPRIVRALSRDGERPCPVIHRLVRYWSAWVDGRFSGVFMTVQHTERDLEVHSLLLASAVRHSRALAQRLLRILFERQGAQRLTAWVCSDLVTVCNFLRKLGFVHEGTRRAACVRGGKTVDAFMFGLLKSDWSSSWDL